LPAAQNVRVVTENTAQNAIKTISGPNVGVVKSRPNPSIMRFGLAALITLIDPFSLGYSIASLVYRLAYNGDVVRQLPDQLAVFQGASDEHI
jgi:hypothetical protein